MRWERDGVAAKAELIVEPCLGAKWRQGRGRGDRRCLEIQGTARRERPGAPTAVDRPIGHGPARALRSAEGEGAAQTR